jgi:hypothetical protein
MKPNPNSEKLNAQVKEKAPDSALLKDKPAKTNAEARIEFYKKVQILRRERRMQQ